MIHFIHSFSTQPLNLIALHGVESLKRRIVNIWCYALSLAYLKKHNFECNLHTDEEGKELLGFLPYDNVYTTCEELKDMEISPRFLAAAKMVALKAENENAIHIDGDVFIKRASLIDGLEELEFDVLVQSDDSSTAYELHAELIKQCEEENYLKDKWDIDIEDLTAYNSGVLWIRNKILKDRFLASYFDNAKHYTEKLKILENLDSYPDIIIELVALKQLSENYVVEKVLSSEDINAEAKEKGYQHMIAFTKYYALSKIKETLRKINPEIYELTLQNTEKHQEEYNKYLQDFIKAHTDEENK